MSDESCKVKTAATATTKAATTAATAVMTPLILKRAPIGENEEDYDVLENGVVVGRIFTVSTAPQDRHWMWASGRDCNLRRAAHGYEATREAAMAADDGLVRGLPTTPAVISSPDCLPCPPCPA